MISMCTDDPVKDAERYAQEQEEEMMENSPVCCECGEHIVEDFYYRIVDDIYCEDCMHKHLEWIR